MFSYLPELCFPLMVIVSMTYSKICIEVITHSTIAWAESCILIVWYLGLCVSSRRLTSPLHCSLGRVSEVLKAWIWGHGRPPLGHSQLQHPGGRQRGGRLCTGACWGPLGQRLGDTFSLSLTLFQVSYSGSFLELESRVLFIRAHRIKTYFLLVVLHIFFLNTNVCMLFWH